MGAQLPLARNYACKKTRIGNDLQKKTKIRKENFLLLPTITQKHYGTITSDSCSLHRSEQLLRSNALGKLPTQQHKSSTFQVVWAAKNHQGSKFLGIFLNKNVAQSVFMKNLKKIVLLGYKIWNIGTFHKSLCRCHKIIGKKGTK